MKLKIMLLIAGAALLVTLACIATTVAAPQPHNVPAIAAASQPSAATPAAEPHPQIKEAIASLRRAKEHMEHAAHDFGGHRVEALKATDEAIHQLETCLKYDKD